MRIMGNLYTDNLIGTVIGLSVADDWEGARREWEIVGCEVDETHSATCVCGKEGLRYVYTIANTETGETLSPIGSSCIKKFEQSDMDEELAGWQQAIKLMEEAARIGKKDYVHLHSGSYSLTLGVRHILPRRLLPSSGCYARMFRRLRPGLRWN